MRHSRAKKVASLHFTIAFLSILVVASNAYSQHYGYAPDLDISLGRGFDPIYPQRSFGRCIAADAFCRSDGAYGEICNKPAQGESYSGAAGPAVFSSAMIHSRAELLHILNINPLLTDAYRPLAATPGLSNFPVDEINDNTLSWVLVAKATYGLFSMKQPALPRSLQALPERQLVSQCGPAIISNIQRGVLAAVIFTLSGLDDAETSRVRSLLDVAFSTQVYDKQNKAPLSDVLRSSLERGTLSIRTITLGGIPPADLEKKASIGFTDLDEVRSSLSRYVSTQDASNAAILDFTTTGIGVYATNPSIDADISNLSYFLTVANDYRLDIIDAISRPDFVVKNASDFSPGEVSKARQLKRELSCELSYSELAMQSCKLTYDIERDILLDGSFRNDRSASLSMVYGVADSKGVPICQGANSPPGYGIRESSTRVALPGWQLTKRVRMVPDEGATACAEKLQTSQTGFSAMLSRITTLPRGPNPRGRASPSEPGQCVVSCDLATNQKPLWEAERLPTSPFAVSYNFNTNGRQQTLTFSISPPEKVQQIRVYVTGQQAPLLTRLDQAARSVISIPLSSITPSDSITLDIESVVGRTHYPFAIPVDSSLQ